MKVVLIFNIPDDRDEYRLAEKGKDFYLAMYDYSQYLRTEWKHGNYDDKEFEVLDKIKEQFCDILDRYNINLDDYN